MFAMKLLTLLLHSYFLVGQCSAESSLDGYAFDCGGVLLGFRGQDQIVCLNGSKVPCGDYIYSESTSVLTGHTSLTGSFLAWSMDVKDGVLISFQSDLGVTCHAVSLDWPNYSTSKFLGLKCPSQNAIPNLSFQDNHFSLGVSGDIALRSPLEFTTGRRLIRDSYGVYQRFDNEHVRMYFGPQKGQPLTVLNGRLTDTGELYVEDYVPPGPCVHDGQSSILNVTELPPVKKITTENEAGYYSDFHKELPYSASATERAIYWILLGTSFLALSALSSS